MNPAGVYIHIPFCRSRCSYCDFATGLYYAARAERYVAAISSEIANYSPGGRPGVDTVYFGGGTPSLLAPAQVARILETVHARFSVERTAEVTLEMNPGGLSREVLREFRHVGINRASFGAQTFDDGELRRLGRSHSAADVRETVRMLRAAGFENVSFDLIAGLPAQSRATWSNNLDEALGLGPEHLSLYLLEIHEGTPLADQIRQGRQPVPDDDLSAEMYELMLDRTAAAGYDHYEISNFCRPGFASRHNVKYWKADAVFGFGCSAHSYDGAFRRWSNERDASQYVEMIECGQSPVVESIAVTEKAQREESVFLGLRLFEGIDLGEYQERFGSDLREEYRDDLRRLREAGLIALEDERMRLTRTGALLSNEVFSVFV